MDFFNSRDKINFIFILSLVSIIFYVTPGWGLEPTVTDVTTRSFSVVWTEGAAINPDTHGCSLTVKKEGEPIESNQIIRPELDAEGQPNEEGRLGLARGVVKFEVIELDPDSAYTVNGKKSNGSTSLFDSDRTVVTEKFKGLSSYADANDNDIVTNDIFHLPLFNDTDGKPALGALVKADIFGDVNCTDTLLSDYSVTGWVGSGMPGKTDTLEYQNGTFDPNNICYKEFAAINLNNLFGQDKFPLQLTGTEYIKIEVIPGITQVEGDAIYKMPLPEITMVNDQKISSAKVGQKINFHLGINFFSFPHAVSEGFTYKMFIEGVYAAGGFIKYFVSHPGDWVRLDMEAPPWGGLTISSNPTGLEDTLIQPDAGYYFYLSKQLDKDFYLSNSPTPTQLTLHAGVNIVNFTEVPDFYTFTNLIQKITDAGGRMKYLVSDIDGRLRLDVDLPPWGGLTISADPTDSENKIIERDKSYLIYMQTVTENPMVINPID